MCSSLGSLVSQQVNGDPERPGWATSEGSATLDPLGDGQPGLQPDFSSAQFCSTLSLPHELTQKYMLFDNIFVRGLFLGLQTLTLEKNVVFC